MSRPGKKITRKHLFMSSKMKELELKERSSRSLLANVLDMDDDFRQQNSTSGGYVHTVSGGRAAGGREGVGGRDSPLPPVPQHAEGAAEHPQGTALHHQENEGRGREPGGHLRLEIRRHGRRPDLPVWVHPLHHPVYLRHHLLGPAPRSVRSDFFVRVTTTKTRTRPIFTDRH
ncbi:acr-16, partial [Trichonephila clavata]